MAQWDEYTQKSTPEAADSLLIKDPAAGANKRTPFSGVWNWILNKLANAVIAQLETNDKTVIGSLNELNSNMKNSKKITSIETSSSGNRFWLSATGSDGEYAFAITNTGIILFKNNNSTWDEITNITI